MSLQDLQEKLQRHLNYLEQDKNNVNLLLSVGLLKATILHHQHQLNEAIVLLEDLTNTHPSNATVLGLLALLYFDKNNAEHAELLSQKALSFDANNYEAQLVQMLLRAMQQDVEMPEIDALLAINPHDCRLWFAAGTVLLRTMNLPKAEHAFLQASSIWPDFYDNWICLGWCYLLQNKLDLAKNAYQHAVNIDENGADGWGGFALICALTQDEVMANQWLEKTQRLDADCFLAAITRIILANTSTPAHAAKQFNTTFPEATIAINQILAQAVLTLESGDRVLH